MYAIANPAPIYMSYKPLKKSYAIQVWGMISFLLLIYEKGNWYHWKAYYSSLQWCAICRDYVIMECAVLLNIGQSQKWNVAKCIVFNTEVSISFEDAMCDWAFVWGETWKSWKSRMKVNSKWMINPKLVDEDTFQLS